MVGALVRDAARRNLNGTWVVLAIVVAVGLAAGMAPHGWMAASMALAFVLGPALALAAFTLREVCLLPVSRQQLWRAQWLLGVVGAPASLLVAKIVAAAVLGVVAPEPLDPTARIVLSALCDVAYCGIFFAALRLLGTPARRGRLVGAFLYAAVILVFVGGVVWPFLIRSYLPTSWGELGGVTGAALAAALVLMAFGYRYRLPAVPRESPRRTARYELPLAQAVTARLASARMQDATGLRLLARRELLIAGLIVAAGLGTILTVETIRGGPAAIPGVLRVLVQPFAADDAAARAQRNAGTFIGLELILWLVLSGRNAIIPLVRQLRTLPLSRWHIIGCVLAFPSAVWAGTLAVLAGLLVTLTGEMPRLDPGQFVLLAGMVAFGHALAVPSGRAFSRYLIVMPLVATALAGVFRLLPAPADALGTPLAIGLLFLLAALAFTDRVLGRSSTYRPPTPGVLATELASR